MSRIDVLGAEGAAMVAPLRELGEVHLAEGEAELAARVRRRECDVVVHSLSLSGVEPLAALAATAAAAGVPLLVLVPNSGGPMGLGTILGRGVFSHVLAGGAGAPPDARTLQATLVGLLGSGAGVERFAAAGAEERRFRCNDSRSRLDLVEEIEAHARQVGCLPLVAQAISGAAEELLTNALYDAPVDAGGHHRHLALSRSVPVVLPDAESAEVRVLSDDRRVVLSVTDPFGSLDAAQVTGALARCFARGADQIRSDAGGAGVGLYFVLTLAHHLALEITPGRRTEAVAVVEKTPSYREYAGHGRGLDVVVRRAA